MGSIGFAVTALAVGYIIKQYGIYSSYIIYSILMLIGLYFVYSINFKPTVKIRKASVQDFIELIKDKRFILFMISVAIFNIAMGLHSTYIYILIQNTGGDVSILGIIFFAMAMSELPTLFYGDNIIKKCGELNLYKIGVFLFGLRMFINSLLSSYMLVIVVQMMQSVTFAFYLLGALQYINNMTKAEVKTSAITFFSAMIGLGAFIGNIGGGILLEHISIFALYKISAVISVIAGVIVVILKRYETKNVVKTTAIIR
jgi:PPP family 3-phenylpropionic acid transporter